MQIHTHSLAHSLHHSHPLFLRRPFTSTFPPQDYYSEVRGVATGRGKGGAVAARANMRGARGAVATAVAQHGPGPAACRSLPGLEGGGLLWALLDRQAYACLAGPYLCGALGCVAGAGRHICTGCGAEAQSRVGNSS